MKFIYIKWFLSNLNLNLRLDTEQTIRQQEWIIVRHSAILPVCLPGVLRLNRKIHKTVRATLHDSIDTASSILMIVLLLFTVIFAGIFCAVEIYSETITVVQLGNDVVNWTLYHRPELMNMFPEGRLKTLYIFKQLQLMS